MIVINMMMVMVVVEIDKENIMEVVKEYIKKIKIL